MLRFLYFFQLFWPCPTVQWGLERLLVMVGEDEDGGGGGQRIPSQVRTQDLQKPNSKVIVIIVKMIRINKRTSRCSQRPPPQLELRRPQFSSQEPGRKRGRTEGKAAWGHFVNFPFSLLQGEETQQIQGLCACNCLNELASFGKDLLNLPSC